MLDWVIIGGGIHGVHLAARLIGEGRVPSNRIRIIDPEPQLLQSWLRSTKNTGMRFLRSPGVHHLDLDPWSLLRFAEAKNSSTKGMFAKPYNRPSVSLFADHCAHVIARFKLQSLHVQGKASSVTMTRRGVRVRLEDDHAYESKKVLLALGASNQPRWPSWATRIRDHHGRIQHIFDPGFVLRQEEWPSSVAVVGGGISAAQAALRLADGKRTVHMLCRHPLRKHQFDSDPGWVGPKNMRRFAATRDLEKRREMIAEARHVGSLPPDVYRAVHYAIHSGTIDFHIGDPEGRLERGKIGFEVGRTALNVDGVLLATGFESARPGGKLIDSLIHECELPCSTCGYPVLDSNLRWHPRLVVTGPLAELEIGPVARNIVGARRAAERILPLVS